MKRTNMTLAAVAALVALAPITGCRGRQMRAGLHSDTGAASVRQPTLGESPLVLLPSYSRQVADLSMGEIAAELEAIADHDRTLTELAVDLPETNIAERIRAADLLHAERARQIVELIGWPTADALGTKAAHGALIAVQHAGHDVDFQDHCLGLMVPLSETGQVKPQYLALLADRIRLFSGESQVFGTQMSFESHDDGTVKAIPAIPIEDVANLDNRRAMMGMPPHDHFARLLEQAYETTGSWRGAQSAVEAWTE